MNTTNTPKTSNTSNLENTNNEIGFLMWQLNNLNTMLGRKAEDEKYKITDLLNKQNKSDGTTISNSSLYTANSSTPSPSSLFMTF